MPFTLEVHFEYLCAFAPPKPFEDTPAPQETWVVLRDLRGEQDDTRRHYPILLYDRNDRFSDQEVQTEGKTPRRPDAKKSKDRRIDLDRVTIELRPEGEKVDAAKLVPMPGLKDLFRIRNAGVGLEVFDEDLLTGQPADLAARLHLRTGTLDVDAEEITPVFDLKKKGAVGDPIHSQELARRVVWTVPIIDHVDFAFTDFGPAPQNETVLRLRSRSIQGKVLVRIRNCEKNWRWKAGLPDYDQSDSEINFYFPLSADYDDNDPPPTLVLQRQDNSNGACAPKRFDSRG